MKLGYGIVNECKRIDYYKCRECGGVIETHPFLDKQKQCLNCESTDLENITKDAPGWVRGCGTCVRSESCEISSS